MNWETNRTFWPPFLSSPLYLNWEVWGNALNKFSDTLENTCEGNAWVLCLALAWEFPELHYSVY